MLYKHFTEKLIGLQDLIVNNIEKVDGNNIIKAKLVRKPHKCPSCGEMTDRVHDYRKQIIKDIPSFGGNTYIELSKRRYRCDNCGKKFIENNTFLPRYCRMTNRLSAYVINSLKTEHSFTSVAKMVNLSVSTVVRIFDLVSYSNKSLPTALSIDEFKGNTDGEKYQCIITDPINKVVLDILPSRQKGYLTNYFKGYSLQEREKVNYFISDMWSCYADLSYIWFKKSQLIIDKYHWIRQVIWAFEAVRKQEQKAYCKSHRIYFKRSRSLLIKTFKSLSDEDKQRVNNILNISIPLYQAHYLKEHFLAILREKDYLKAKKLLADWILTAQSSNIPNFVKAANTIQNWFVGISNSLNSNLTNGFTEGCNNKIKVLKRNAYGYRNFSRFRNRILHMFS